MRSRKTIKFFQPRTCERGVHRTHTHIGACPSKFWCFHFGSRFVYCINACNLSLIAAKNPSRVSCRMVLNACVRRSYHFAQIVSQKTNKACTHTRPPRPSCLAKIPSCRKLYLALRVLLLPPDDSFSDISENGQLQKQQNQHFNGYLVRLCVGLDTNPKSSFCFRK